MQELQSGLSQVPLRRPGTFQSHSWVEGLPQAQRRRSREVQTIARPPSGRMTGVQGIQITPILVRP